jgi:predicted nuclease of predicted toxin-antitoxin system
MRILADEDSQEKRVVQALRDLGNDVLTVNEAGLSGAPDHVILSTAKRESRVVLTKNCEDFRELHEVDPRHFGILAHYYAGNRHLSFGEISRAIRNIDQVYGSIEGEFIAINSFTYGS